VVFSMEHKNIGRNILICGTSGSGKKTLCKVLQDWRHCPEKKSTTSESHDLVIKSFYLKNKELDALHILNVIVAPTSHKFGEFLVKCDKEKVAALSMANLCMTVRDSVSSKDVDSITLFVKMFGGYGIPVILCITHADKHNKHQRESISAQIKSHPQLATFFTTTPENPAPLLEILFMGCVDYHEHLDENVLQMYMDVVELRTKFLSKIFTAEKQLVLTQCTGFISYKAKMSEIFGTCYNELTFLSKADPESVDYTSRLEDNKYRMECLYNNTAILEHGSSLAEEAKNFWKLILNIRKSAKKCNFKAKQQKAELIHPWSLS